MARFFFARLSRLQWTPEECAVFAANKEFELLKLVIVNADKKVVSMARRMGIAIAAAAQRNLRNEELMLLELRQIRRKQQLLLLLRVRESAGSASASCGLLQPASCRYTHGAFSQSGAACGQPRWTSRWHRRPRPAR